MQPGWARTSGLGVPRLPLARWVGWVAPVHATHGVLVLSCPSAALRVHVCAVSWATWLLFAGVLARCVVLSVRRSGPPGSRSPVCPLGVLFCVCGVLGHLAAVHRCARSVRCFARAASSATWLLFTGAPAWFVVLRVRCAGPLGSCSPVHPLGVLLCSRSDLGHLAPVHRCACSVCYVACVVSWATWLLFTGVPARCVVLRVRCPGPFGSCSPVCPLGVLSSVACAVSWATWLLFTGVRAPSFAVLVRCPGRLGSCSPASPLGVLCCVCGVLGHLAPVRRCARLVRCFACAVSSAPWLLLSGVPARCVVLRVRCPWPLGSCSPVHPLGVLCCVYGVLGPLAPVHRCAPPVCCVACVVSWATWLLFTGVPAPCAVSRVRCPVPLGSCSLVRPLGVLCCVYSVLGPLAPVHRFARSVCCVLHVRCPGPLGSCSPLCPLGVLCPVCGVLDHLAPVHQRARLVCCVACAVSWAPDSCSPVYSLGWLRCVCAVLGQLALVYGCARSVCCVVLRVRCPGPLGSCSPLCSLGVLRFGLRLRGVAAGRSLIHPDGGCS